ncbi:MAG TPA: YlxR family protein [Candidatus Dormibacteraeota bacterium]|nr:YlxR family protein [Candidatus Dormibacteraeota bacterium]
MPKRRHQPVRTCIACRQEAGKGELVRLVRVADGSAAVDRTGHLPGRGAYLHHNQECVETARKRRQLERSLGAAVPQELWAELG